MVKKEENTWPEINKLEDKFNDLESTISDLRKLLRRCDYIFEIYKVDKEDVRDRFDSTLFDELAKELDE